MGAEGWDEQVGSVADEATRLLESLRRSAADAAAGHRGDGGPAEDDVAAGTGRRADDPPLDGEPAEARTAAHDPFCTWCPLCRSAAVLRSLSPETLVRLADLAGVAATVLADLASARARATQEDPASGEATPAGDASPPPTANSRPIPVLDADDPQEAPRG